MLEPLSPSDYILNFQSRASCVWKCLVGNSKKWKEGKIFAEVSLSEPVSEAAPSDVETKLRVSAQRIKGAEDGSSEILFEWENADFTFGNIIEKLGKIPIPPYLNRESETSDIEDYQTVYARMKGSVAAPTAGLHFTPEVFEAMNAHNISVSKVTLHVGAGTFRPVKSDTIGDHEMHSEPFSISADLIRQLIEWKSQAKPVIAVGTTSVRTLESLPYIGNKLMQKKEDPFRVTQWMPYSETENDFDTITALKELLRYMETEGIEVLNTFTSIMIAPGFKWRITDGILTNFHQPKSTLLLLVSSFLGGDDWRELYKEALDKNYRFLSYGDASLLLSSNIR